MIVCSCNVLTDKQVAQVARSLQPRSPTISEVYTCLRCQPRCGRCAITIKKICDEAAGVTAHNRADTSAIHGSTILFDAPFSCKEPGLSSLKSR
jgi:bacterioferritin-associated ferredoxin